MATVRELITKLGFKTDTKSIDEFDGHITNAKTSILALTAAIGTATTAMVLFIESAAKAGDRLDKLRDIIGMTTQNYQLLEGAANLAGIENDEFSKSLQLFARSIGMARQGMGQYIKQFAILGINLRDSNGQVKSNKDLLLEVADAFKNKLTNSVDRAAVSQLLFGRSGAKLINFLEGGSKGVKAAMAEYKEYAFILDKQAIKQSKELTDRQFLLSAAFKGLKNEIGVGMMPVMKRIINETLKWIKTNRKLITSTLIKFFKSMIVVAKVLGKTMVVLIDAIKYAVQIWKDLNEAFGMTVKIITGLLALQILAKIKMFKRLITGGLGIAKFILSPVGMITTAIVALLLVLDDLAVYLTGGKSLIGTVIKKFPIVGTVLKKMLSGLKLLINLTILMPLKIIKSIASEIMKLIDSMSSRATGMAKTLTHFGLPAAGPTGFPGVPDIAKRALLHMSPGGATTNNATRNINFNTSVNLTVPHGTPEMQQAMLKTSAEKIFEPAFNKKLRDALSVFPGVEQ
jgi:hypothetical protein